MLKLIAVSKHELNADVKLIRKDVKPNLKQLKLN